MRLSGSSQQPNEDANPYALLNSNFDSEFYDRDINIYKESNQMSSRASPTNCDNSEAAEMIIRSASDTSHGSDFHLTNFTYDKMDGERFGDCLKQGSKPMGRPSNGISNNLVNIAITKRSSGNVLRES